MDGMTTYFWPFGGGKVFLAGPRFLRKSASVRRFALKNDQFSALGITTQIS